MNTESGATTLYYNYTYMSADSYLTCSGVMGCGGGGMCGGQFTYVVVHDVLTGDKHILHKLQLYTIIFTSPVQCGPVYIVSVKTSQ